MQVQQIRKQQGISIVGLIFVLGILAVLGILGLKIVPTVLEYNAIKNAVVKAKTMSTPAEARLSFEKQSSANYIESISEKDLEIVKVGDELEISFAYEKKIPLFGPASILIEYKGTTSKNPPVDKAPGA